MQSIRNSVRLIGNLGMNPDVKALNSGKKVAKFSLATTETYKDEAGNKVKETQWHNLVAWGRQAEIIEKYVAKGDEIAIEGKIMNRNYTDKEGVKKYITEIVVSEMMMLTHRK